MTLKRLILSLVLLLGMACAQPLAALAPADTALALSFSYRGGLLDTLDDDFAALPWDAGKTAAAKLLRALAGASDDPALSDLWTAYADMLELGERPDPARLAGMPGMDELLELCPALQGMEGSFDYQERYPEGVPSEGLVTVSISPYSPVPVATALLRVDGGAAPFYQEVQDALLSCAQESGGMDVVTLEQDGVPLYVVGDGGDFPVVVGSLDELFFIGTNPEALRGVIRRANAGGGGSLAETALYRATAERFGDSANSLGLSLDFGALANALASVGGMASDPSESYLLGRGVEMLRTLGAFGAQLSASDEGLLSESLLLPNPEGGDEALLELLACEGCRVSSPLLAPEGTVALSAQYLPYREVWAYLEDWLDGLAAAGGEDLDLRALLRDEFGFDLDVALFDWLGSEVQSFTLEPVGPDLRTLIYNPGQVLVVPVSSVDAARAGLAEWARALGPLWQTVLQEGELGSDEALGEVLTASLDVRETSYRGVPLTRVRFGPNFDLAYGFLGNYLVAGTPAAAAEAVIDTFQGAPGFAGSAEYRALRDELPEAPSALHYSDDARMVRGLAALLEVVVQPLAFVTEVALQEWLEDAGAQSEGGVEDMDEPYTYGADLEGVAPTPLAVPGEASGELAAPALISDFYELEGLEPGQKVEVVLDSSVFDTYLALLDADSGEYLLVADDTDDSTRSSFTFEADGETRYWLEASSSSGAEVGGYSLTVNVLNNPAWEATPLTTDGSLGVNTGLNGVSPTVLSGSDHVNGELVDDGSEPASSTHYYELTGLTPGDEVSVTLQSDDFDTYLYLIDAERSLYLDENDDDATSTDSELSFTAEEGVRYWLGVASYSGDTGAYTLTVSASPGTPMGAAEAQPPPSAEDLPTFGELLDLFGLLPETLGVLADHLSTSTSYTQLGENGIYSRSLMRLRW